MIQLNETLSVNKTQIRGLGFFFSFFSCIFASRDICFGEYGYISKLVYIFELLI